MEFGDIMVTVESKSDNSKAALHQRNDMHCAANNANAPYSVEADLTKKVSIFPSKNIRQNTVKDNDVFLGSKEEITKSTGFSKKFINNLISLEGFKLTQYVDGNGNKSIGVGHNISADSTYKCGTKITKEQAYNLLKNDLIEAKKLLKKLTPQAKYTQNQEEAMVDLVFNVGEENLKNSKLIKKLNEGKFDDAAKEFNFIKVGKNVSTHLCRRRMQNISTFYEKAPSPSAIKSLSVISKAGLAEYDRKICENKGFFSGLKLQISKFIFSYRANSMIKSMTKNYRKAAKN